MKEKRRVFGEPIVGEFFCLHGCGYSVFPNTLHKEQNHFKWVESRDNPHLLVPACPKCGRALSYDEAC